jgi:hypothetical protein
VEVVVVGAERFDAPRPLTVDRRASEDHVHRVRLHHGVLRVERIVRHHRVQLVGRADEGRDVVAQTLPQRALDALLERRRVAGA